MTCRHCDTVNTSAALFCVLCGHALRDQDEVECEIHSGTIATGICTICGKPVCDDCSVGKENKLYCDDVAHSQLTTVYTKLAAVASEFDADMLVKNLSVNGVIALYHSAKKYSQFCRFTDDASISVFVRTEKIDEAKRLLKEMDIEDFLIHKAIRL